MLLASLGTRECPPPVALTHALQVNLVKQIQKLVKVRYVEDITDSTRIGALWPACPSLPWALHVWHAPSALASACPCPAPWHCASGIMSNALDAYAFELLDMVPLRHPQWCRIVCSCRVPLQGRSQALAAELDCFGAYEGTLRAAHPPRTDLVPLPHLLSPCRARDDDHEAAGPPRPPAHGGLAAGADLPSARGRRVRHRPHPCCVWRSWEGARAQAAHPACL